MILAIGSLVLIKLRKRQPEIGVNRILLPGRHHSRHGEALPVDLHGSANDGRIAREAALPQAMTDHYHVESAVAVLGGKKSATQLRLDAERGKQIGGSECVAHRLRLAIDNQLSEVVMLIAIGSQALETLGLPAPIEEVRIAGGNNSRLGMRLFDEDQPSGVMKGQ